MDSVTLVISILGGILSIPFMYLLAESRKAPSTSDELPSYVQAFSSPLPPASILKTIARFAPTGGYRVEAIDEINGRIILNKPSSMIYLYSGFFYPIFLTSQSDGTTLVQIGIKPKIHQAGPMTKDHDKCVNDIKVALFCQS